MFGKKRDKEKEAKLALAAQQHRYLIDCRGDIAFLQKMIELVNKDDELQVDMTLIDGTKLSIRRAQPIHSSAREGIWDR